MNRGSADEAVVVVKVGADDFMVTWMRVKRRESDRDVGDEGRNTKAAIAVI
jgi:hypothetical protein